MGSWFCLEPRSSVVVAGSPVCRSLLGGGVGDVLSLPAALMACLPEEEVGLPIWTPACSP